MANTSDSATEVLWRHIWNVRRGTIDSFRAIFNSIGLGNPTALQAALTAANFADLKGWPAKGSQTAIGYNGQLISMLATATRDYAPFVDVDGDGKYNYLMGDYPQIKGNQMLWTVYNDMAGQKTQSNTYNLGMEMQLSAYAYANGTATDNVQFYEYKIYNRGNYQLDSARVSVWADLDLGYASDDYIGFDSAHRMGYVYNGDDTDGGGPTFYPNWYGTNLPISGIVLLETVGDVLPNRVPPGAFTSFSNSGSGVPPGLADPSTGLEFYRYMSGVGKFGQPFTNPLTGQATTTIFTGNPLDTAQWSECALHNPPGDRRFVLSSAPFTMMPGTDYKVAFALVVSPTGGGCPNAKITDLNEAADSALALYRNPNYATAVRDVSVFSGVKLFPNPATSMLTIQNLPSASIRVQVLDVMGRKIALSQQQTGKDITLNTAALSAGVYLLQMTGENAVETRRFVKE